jgi:hypothetical protein
LLEIFIEEKSPKLAKYRPIFLTERKFEVVGVIGSTSGF